MEKENKNKNGCLTAVLIIFIGLIGITVLFGGITLSHRNTAVAKEEQIKAQFESNKSSYDTMWKKFKEMTQVTELQSEQMKETYTDLISGRYSDTDTLMKMVKEDNPKLSTEVYTALQTEIASNRDIFNNDQKKIADMISQYNTYIKKKFIMAAITGRTPMDSEEYIVTSDKTKDAFNTGKDDYINLKE